MVVESTYDRSETDGRFTIGAVMTGGYPLDTRFVFWLYREMAQNQLFLERAVDGDLSWIRSQLTTSPDLAIHGHGDGGINDIPGLPQIEAVDANQAEITQIARARIASFIKFAGYCEAKNLVPVFNSPAYANLASELINKTTEALNSIEGDPYWNRRNRLLSLCHEEHLVDEMLDALSIEDVIRLRTKAWGEQAKARDDLFCAIATLASELPDDHRFAELAREKIREYRKESEAVQNERSALHLRIKCDIATGILAGGVASAGLLSQLQSPLSSVGLTLATGGAWAFQKAKDYVPQLQQMQAVEAEMKRGAAFGLHNFYSRL